LPATVIIAGMTQFIYRHAKLGAVAVSCAALGAGVSAISGAGASTTHTNAAKPAAARAALPGPGRRARLLARHTIDGQLVVATKNGFEHVTIARGTVQSVSGQQLTIAEGTRNATYRTVTMTLPATTTVRDDRANATLAQVQAGQRALVIVGPDRALVIARTPASAGG